MLTIPLDWQERLTSMNDDEIELTGGNSNTCVVKIGNTVRRAVGEQSPTVHRILQFLSANGFKGSPRFIGIDDKGREILSFLHGSCEISERAWTSEEVLISAATLLKEFHDVIAQFPKRSDDIWGFEYPDKNRHDTICHNDFALYNVVINDNICSGVIDFDLVGPGPRIRDVAYAAYWFVPISQNALDMKSYALSDVDNGCARLKKFCKICNVRANSEFLDMVSEVLHDMADEDMMIRLIGAEQTRRLKEGGHLEHWTNEALAFDQYRGSIELEL